MIKQEGHGSEERQVVETTITENNKLSGFRDTVGTKTESQPVIIPSIFDGTDPYPNQGLTQLLTRPYLTQSFPWAGTDAINTKLFQGNYPQDLLAIDNINEKLNRFKLLRAGVHVEVRLNSTTYHSGKLAIVYSPHYNTTNPSRAFKQDDMYSECGFLPTITVSAVANETVGFDIPYVGPSSYFDLADDPSSDEFRGFFGMFKIYVLSPLKLVGSTTTPSIVVSIYSNFIDPQVAGFTPKHIGSNKNVKSSRGVATDPQQTNSKIAPRNTKQ